MVDLTPTIVSPSPIVVDTLTHVIDLNDNAKSIVSNGDGSVNETVPL